MTEHDYERSGELSSFLHLTGWRPVALALVAGIAAAVGLYGALGAPVEWVARYVVNVQDVADDDMMPNEVALLADEMVVDMQLPQTIAAVETRTELVEEDDYEIVVRQSAASSSLIDINVVAEDPDGARAVAVETAIAGINETLGDQRDGLQATIDGQATELAVQEAREEQLIEEADGVNPDTAYIRAENEFFERRELEANPGTIVVRDADGNETVEQAPLPDGPSSDELKEEVERLEPIRREYLSVRTLINDLNVRLADRRDSIRELDATIDRIEIERTAPNIIREVDTEEASRISGLLTGILIFAIPAALLMILLFVLYDMIFGKSDEALVAADPIDAHGVLEAASTRALPVTALKVVDEEQERRAAAAAAAAAAAVIDGAPESAGDGIYDAGNDFDDDPDRAPKPKSKASRWGRDAGSKAG